MQKVLLIESPYLDLYGKSKIAVSPYFPLGLGYLGSVLEKAGHDVKIIVDEQRGDFLQMVLSAIRSFLPDLIGISSMTPNYPNAINIANKIKEDYRIPIVIGGHHVSVYKESILQKQPAFDFVIYGEGEDTIIELVENLESGAQALKAIDGLVFRYSGEVIRNQPRKLKTDVDSIPFPSRDLLNMNQFSTHSHIGGGKSATILTSRGCPYLCSFCSAHNVDGRKYRGHSVDYVIREIEELKLKYKISYLFFQDDTFTLKRDRVTDICSELVRKNLNINFGCFSRVDVMDHKMAEILKRAGCTNVIFGVESGSEKTLQNINKKQSLDKVKSAIQACNDTGLKSTASFVIGFPVETVADVEQTINFAISLDCTIAVFNPLVPFPGSSVFNAAIHTPDSDDGWSKFLTVDIPPFSLMEGLSPKEVYQLSQKGHRRFYLRPKQLWNILKSVRGLNDLKEHAKSAYAVFSR